MEKRIELIAKEFLEKTKDKDIQIISHFDTDGITSAAIMIKTLKKLDKTFSVKIVKNLEEQIIKDLPKDKVTIFLDLASNSLNYIKEAELKDVFIIDHHEIIQEIPEDIRIVNPELHDKEKISGSGMTYLFCKEINPDYKELAKLAVLGMIGDCLEKNIDKINNKILTDAEIIKKRGLLLYPSTRPLNRVLEYSSNPYLPGITGDTKGALNFLRETGLTPKNGTYPSIIELNEKEMSKVVTAIMLLKEQKGEGEIIGDIFLIKLFNKLEDARELSAKINACSRFGESQTAIQLCLEIPSAKKRAEAVHVKYRQLLVSGLKFASDTEKIQGNGYVIINARDQIKDTVIGTVASILSNSFMYEKGTTIIAMAYDQNKIKISSRNVGRKGKNVRIILNDVVSKIGGEVGGHEFAAGCLIEKHQEQEFIDGLKKNFEIEVVKV